MPFKFASTLLGAFLCLLVSACNEKKATPDWEQSTPQTTSSTSTPSLTKASVPPAQQAARSSTSQKKPKHQEVRFLAYNLKNYLTMHRYIHGKASQRFKPDQEINALIRVIKSARPHVLGVCEIGNEADLKDLQKRLKAAGVDLPHTHRVQGADRVRALAILSRYPIINTAAPQKIDYSLNGQPFQLSRGVLDTTIQLPQRRVRFLGVHLKSKRPSRGADQELMRRNESALLRKHIDDILNTDPNTPILVYGDFNDTRQSKSIATVRGRTSSPKQMTPIELTDSRGENWTHNWKREDIYSRFDYAMTNRTLTPAINQADSRIIDHQDWDLASDHRALLILIK